MHYFLFILFVVILGSVLVGSCVFAHCPPKRYTAGWWAGVLLALVLIAYAQPHFQDLPTHTTGSGCTEATKVIWSEVVPQATNMNWTTFCIGLIIGILAFEILERLTKIPDKVMAFILLFLSFTSLGMLVYIFLIRKATYLIFSFVMGSFLSWFLHIAFISRLFKQNDDN